MVSGVSHIFHEGMDVLTKGPMCLAYQLVLELLDTIPTSAKTALHVYPSPSFPTPPANPHRQVQDSLILL